MKKHTELRELLGFKPVSLMVSRGRLRSVGHVEWKDELIGSIDV